MYQSLPPRVTTPHTHDYGYSTRPVKASDSKAEFAAIPRGKVQLQYDVFEA